MNWEHNSIPTAAVVMLLSRVLPADGNIKLVLAHNLLSNELQLARMLPTIQSVEKFVLYEQDGYTLSEELFRAEVETEWGADSCALDQGNVC